MYGWRGRIGLLVPSINTTMETEFWRIAPDGVSVHSARISGGRHGTPEELRSMENASKAAARDVAIFKRPERLVLVDKLPRNPMNKVVRKDLRDLVLARLP